MPEITREQMVEFIKRLREKWLKKISEGDPAYEYQEVKLFDAILSALKRLSPTGYHNVAEFYPPNEPEEVALEWPSVTREGIRDFMVAYPIPMMIELIEWLKSIGVEIKENPDA